MIKRICKICKKEFQTQPYRIKRGGGKYCSRKCQGINRWKGGKTKQICQFCKKEFWAYKSNHRKYCSRKCKNTIQSRQPSYWKGKKRPYMVGEKHPRWKGGKIIISSGYILIFKPNHPFAIKKYIREHRLIIEKQIGRYLHRWEICHHINKIKNDNRPENLMAFISKSAHQRFEQDGVVKAKEIIFNGKKK